MITAPVSEEKLNHWKKLWQDAGYVLTPNRIRGIQLNEYFQSKYSPMLYEDRNFQEVVKRNLVERYGEEAGGSANIICYMVKGEVYVGIDLVTGFFHVEGTRVEKCVPIYDDLFVKRGLDREDLQNFVLVGQYIELLEAGSPAAGTS